MVERQRQRLEQEMTKMVDEIDIQFLRRMQVKFYHCRLSFVTINLFLG